MDMEKFTERSRGVIQSAQGLALRSGHQRFMPEHVLKILLDDDQGLAANLMTAAGAHPRDAAESVTAELEKLPKVEGSGAGQVYLAPESARLFESADAESVPAESAAAESVPAESAETVEPAPRDMAKEPQPVID